MRIYDTYVAHTHTHTHTAQLEGALNRVHACIHTYVYIHTYILARHFYFRPRAHMYDQAPIPARPQVERHGNMYVDEPALA